MALSRNSSSFLKLKYAFNQQNIWFISNRAFSQSVNTYQNISTKSQDSHNNDDWFSVQSNNGKENLIANYGTGSQELAKSSLTSYIGLIKGNNAISTDSFPSSLRKVFIDYSNHTPDVPKDTDVSTLLNPNSIAAPQYSTLKWVSFKRYIKQTRLLRIHPPPAGVFGELQIKRGAELVTNVVNFLELVQKTGKIPLISETDPLQSRINDINNLFGNLERNSVGDKIHITKDRLTNENKQSEYFVAIFDNHFFRIPIYKKDGSRLSVAELVESFLNCSRKTFNTSKLPLNENFCFYNGLSRPLWVPIKENLAKKHPEFFKTMNDSLFVISFDSVSVRDYKKLQIRQFAQSKIPVNRYFDKAISFVVSNNSNVGALINTSVVDTDISNSLFNYMMRFEPPYYDDVKTNLDLPIPPVDDITIKVEKGTALSGETTNYIKQDMGKIWDRTTFSSLSMPHLGGKYIREVVGLETPDAFVNLVIGLAFYRVFNEVPVLYHRNANKENRYAEIVPSFEPVTKFITSFDDKTIPLIKKTALFTIASEYLNKVFTKPDSSDLKKTLQPFYMFKNDFEISNKITTGDGIQSGILTQSLVASQLDSDFALFTESFGGKYNNSGLADTSDFKFKFESGINPSTNGGVGVSYGIDENGLRFLISLRKTREGQNGIDAQFFTVDLQRAIRDMTFIFPQRSEIWGNKFLFEQQEEHKLTRAFERMKVLSERYEHKYSDKTKEKYDPRIAKDIYHLSIKN